MSHNAWLLLHILGVVLFVGNIIVTAVWKMLADRTKDPPVVAYAQRMVTITDVAFTATGVILIIVAAQVMAEDYGGVFSGPLWLTLGWSLFIASGVIWLTALIPIEVMQHRLANGFRYGGTPSRSRAHGARNLRLERPPPVSLTGKPTRLQGLAPAMRQSSIPGVRSHRVHCAHGERHRSARQAPLQGDEQTW